MKPCLQIKALCFIVGAFCSLIFPALLPAQDPDLIQRRQAIVDARNKFVPRDPWRASDGATNYVKIHGVEFYGKIVDITSGGVIINGSYGRLYGDPYPTPYAPSLFDYNDFFVAHFPFDVVNDQVIPEDEHLMAWYVGTYTYTTVSGGSRTIKKLDYGVPCEPPAPTKEQIEAAKAKAILGKKQVEEGQINAVKWLQSQATNGDAGAQFSLGIHYLNGKGCETNRELAVYWLKESAAQGNIEASNKLSTLKP
jgi:hypothetical protein